MPNFEIEGIQTQEVRANEVLGERGTERSSRSQDGKKKKPTLETKR